MRKIYFTIFAVILTYGLSGQVIISQNFDSFTAGSKVASSAGNPWSTWSSAPGGTEDGTISATQYSSASNSAYIANGNDQVLLLGDKTTGRYKFSFKIFVESGKLGYFNILNDFNGNNSIWAMQAFMKSNGYLVVDAGVASADSAAFSFDTWVPVSFIMDIDDDLASMYVNNTMLVTWKLSGGSYGTGSIHKLDAVNFYGWNNNGAGTAGYYIDDVVFEQVVAPLAPSNLSVSYISGNYEMSWADPVGSSQEFYGLFKNDKLLNLPIASANTYTEVNPYPSNDIFKIRAYYNNEGFSHPAQDTVAVPGAIERNLVLFEIITGTWCTYCPGAALGADDLTTNNYDVAIIEYHYEDPYETSNVTIRDNYYNPQGIPFTGADGVITTEGGNHTTSLYPQYQTMFAQRQPVASVARLHLNVVPNGGDSYTANVSVKQTHPYFGNTLKLYTALTESDIPESWQGLSKLDFVCRNLYPDGNGTLLDFSSSDSLNFSFNFTTTNYVKNNCEFVAFVQHPSSKEVVQTAKIKMSDVVGISSYSENPVKLFPNPASDYIRIVNSEGKNLVIENSIGEIVFTEVISSSDYLINTTNFKSGIYFARVPGSNSAPVRFVIQ